MAIADIWKISTKLITMTLRRCVIVGAGIVSSVLHAVGAAGPALVKSQTKL